MSTNHLNLLPEGRSTLLLRTYRMRLGVVLCGGIVVITAIAGVLLIPTHLLLAGSIAEKEARLEQLNVADTSTAPDVSGRLSELSKRMVLLTEHANVGAATPVVRAVLGVARPGISIFNFSYTIAGGGKSSTVLISGTATTRDTLHAYQLALQSASFVSAATLPVSSYAKDVDVPFTITVILKP